MRIKVKQMILIIVVSAVVYLVVGAMAPFIKYKEVSSQARDSFRPEDFRSGETGMDRAMILETSQSAWEHRLRLLDGAKSRIILSTFDMRNGESTKELLSVILHKAEEGVQVQILVDGFSGLIRMEPDPLFYAVSSHPNIERSRKLFEARIPALFYFLIFSFPPNSEIFFNFFQIDY